MGGGGGKGSKDPPSSPYETAQAQIAQDTYKETAPIRDTLLFQMQDFLKGGDPSKSPTFAPLYANARAGIESQYNVARENVLGNTPRGGAQVSALTGLESDRAGNIGNAQNAIESNIFNDILQKTYGVAFNAPQQSMAGLGQAGSSYANRFGAANQAYSSQYGTNMDAFSRFGESMSSMAKPTVICTELYRQGVLTFALGKVGMLYGQLVGFDVYRGYRILADPIVDRMKKSSRVSRIVAFICVPAIREMAFQLGTRERGSLFGRMVMAVGIPLCRRAHRKEMERIATAEVA
jgi:hypothetical protein